MRFRPQAIALAVGLVSLTAVSSAEATTSEALSLPQLVDQATHVVLVTCVGARTSRDGRQRIVTDYDLSIEEVMKGAGRVGQVLTMRSLGGEMGDLGMRIEGEPHLALGQRYLVFLRTLGDRATLRPVGMSQGVMTIEEQTGARVVMPGGAGLSLVSRAQGGGLSPAPPAILHPEPYESVRARIERRLEEQRAERDRGGSVSP